MHPDGTVQMEALTPALRIDCDWRDDRQRDLLARFVQGLRNAFVGLKAYYESPSRPVPGYRSCEESVSIDRWLIRTRIRLKTVSSTLSNISRGWRKERLYS